RLPLTLATFRGVLVETAGQVFVAPVAVVERVLRVRKSEIRTVEGKETIQFAGQAVALVRLDETLELARSETDDQTAYFHCLIINAAGNRIAFIVNAILGEQEVIVKSPGTQLARVRNIAGATVLGSGRIALILNAADLVKSAVRLSGQAAPVVSRHEAERKRRTVLVAEDSITSRTLLRNVLESAGYQVRTATDGLDAWAALKTESFDLLVSDVEMPRLDGFALTERVRGDEQLRELPVVLVTALASAEDRARGVDAGANAYVVKSSFDQGSLLEVIRRLIG
ncbi:MAG TPA: response regulator, partial [Blastocatellia bacterium]|nr:response regulator [Blastocatellia bacterium]